MANRYCLPVSVTFFCNVMLSAFIVESCEQSRRTEYVYIERPVEKERCDGKWLTMSDTSKIWRHLKGALYGQDMAIDTIVNSILAHTSDADPKKALVLALVGPTGVGKTYTSRLIAESLYAEGIQSEFVKTFSQLNSFQDTSKLPEVQDWLQREIVSTLRECARSLFIFEYFDVSAEPSDEQLITQKLMDTVKPFMDYNPRIHGVDSRKAIFIFVGNVAQKEITTLFLDNREKGASRDNMNSKELQKAATEVIRQRFGRTQMVTHDLVTDYVPFLPLEMSHVKECIRDSLLRLKHPISESVIGEVVYELDWEPSAVKRVYSRSGCKKVDDRVRLLIYKSRSDL